MGTLHLHVVWLLLLGVYVFPYVDAFSGTKKVKWTAYPKLDMTWNEASLFCKQQGGHLPMTNTKIALNVFKKAVHQLSATNGKDSVWIGLYSPDPIVLPYTWEATCSSLPLPMHLSDDDNSGNMDASYCVRLKIDNGRWEPTKCNIRNPHVVCESIEGNCTYDEHKNKTINGNNAGNKNASSNEECWSHCLGFRQNGLECVGAVLKTSSCFLFVWDKLLGDSHLQHQQESTAMLRRCFQGLKRNNQTSHNITSNDKETPEVTCSARGTSTTAGHQATPTIDGQQATPTIDGQQATSTIDGQQATPTIDGQQATSTIDGQQATSTIDGQQATSTIDGLQATSTIDGQYTIDGQQATSTIDGLQAMSTIDGQQATSTIDGQQATSTTAGRQTTPASTEQLATTNAVHTKERTTTAPKMSATRMCPCSCKFKQTLATTSSAKIRQPDGLRIPANNTSKHRRSKTSVATAATSNTVIGWISIIACSSLFGLCLLSDLHRLYLWRRRRRVQALP